MSLESSKICYKLIELRIILSLVGKGGQKTAGKIRRKVGLGTFIFTPA